MYALDLDIYFHLKLKEEVFLNKGENVNVYIYYILFIVANLIFINNNLGFANAETNLGIKQLLFAVTNTT